MIAQGLLVEGPNGESFLLATEPDLAMETHRLVVMQKLNGKWEPLEGMRESACREALIGAFVDFFVDLCRVLNSSGHEPVGGVVPHEAIQSSSVRNIRIHSGHKKMASRIRRTNLVDRTISSGDGAGDNS